MKTRASTNADAIAIAKDITLALIAKAPPKSGASPTAKGQHAGKIFKAVLKQVVEAMEDCNMLTVENLTPDEVKDLATKVDEARKSFASELGITDASKLLPGVASSPNDPT
jgi:hypothetical protein